MARGVVESFVPQWRAGRTLVPMSSHFSLAVVPGDGIGTEVVAEALKVLDAVGGPHATT